MNYTEQCTKMEDNKYFWHLPEPLCKPALPHYTSHCKMKTTAAQAFPQDYE
jgi:hypothetical protein